MVWLGYSRGLYLTPFIRSYLLGQRIFTHVPFRIVELLDPLSFVQGVGCFHVYLSHWMGHRLLPLLYGFPAGCSLLWPGV